MLVIPYSYSPERFGVFSPDLCARQLYDLVNEYVLGAIFGQWEFLDLCIKQVVLVSDHKKHTLAVPIVKEGEITITTVCDDHRMRWDGDAERAHDVSALAIGNIHELRKKAVIIKQL